jgi:hypothetical protein
VDILIKYFILFLALSFNISFGQIGSNLFPKLIESKSDSLASGFDLYGIYKNNAINHYDNYKNKFHYIISPYLYYKFNSQVSFKLRATIENIRESYTDENKTYWSDEFSNHRGGIEIGIIEFSNSWLNVRFGRDYFIPGIHLYENLLFSKYNYPYDQLKIAFKNEYFELSTFYLSLNSFSKNNILFQRHLNGHRLSFDMKFGYIALTEIIIYGGEQRQIELALFNPLLLYYPFQKNKRHFESNSLMSLEFFLIYYDYFIFGEFLLDDFQIDKKAPGDLEPSEYGINLTIGKNNILTDCNLKMNYTKVANRTFNAPIKDYEKFIYKNYPIGHFLGNNFWEIKSTFEYKPKDNLKGEITFYYHEYGEESLYSDFNNDYLNYTIQQGYEENFPFGIIKKQFGLNTSIEYSFSKSIVFRNNFSYWFSKGNLDKRLNYSFGFFYHY